MLALCPEHKRVLLLVAIIVGKALTVTLETALTEDTQPLTFVPLTL